MDDEELLNSIVRGRIVYQKRQAQSVGAIFDKYVKNGLRRHRRQGRVVALWEEMLPHELLKHCRLVSLLRGVLKVEVEAGPYMFEMQSIRQVMLEKLQQNCPGAGVDNIKLVACASTKVLNEKEKV
jgi:predicted nucleic acid-binding Zn ribbon protein